MRFCKKPSPLLPAIRALITAVVVASTAAASMALAGQIEPKEASLVVSDETYALTAEFAIDLGPRLEEAVARGVPLFFNLEVVVERPRQFWAAEHIATKLHSQKLSYSSLTRQYRLSSGGLSQSFETLNDALRILGRAGSLPVADKALLKPGDTYQVAVRLSLDRNQLPKPFQVDAITDKDWRVEAKTLRWTFKP
jgi:hypothetical protein